MRRKKGWLYILKCADESYYTGSTSLLEQRLVQHESGTVEGFTSKHLPFTVALVLEFGMIHEAAAAEKQIKGWTRKKKEALIAGKFDLLHNLAVCRNVTNFRNKGTPVRRDRTSTPLSPSSDGQAPLTSDEIESSGGIEVSPRESKSPEIKSK